MDFKLALSLFRHTLEQESRVRPDIHAAMLKLAQPEVIQEASFAVSSAIALGQRVWMTADLHLGHANIIGFCDRPFHSVGVMNAALLAQLSKVGPEEILVIVGDVLMGEYEQSIELVRQIPGRKILVVGNHDFKRDGRCPMLRERNLSGEGPLFEAVVPFLVWSGAQGRTVLVTHYPLQVPDAHRVLLPYLNYHGHLHRGVLPPTEKVKYMNVGWDVVHGLVCL